MAEKQANLIGSGGGMSVKLRTTVTNSGNQSRGAMLAQLYSVIKQVYDDDIRNLFAMHIVCKFVSGTRIIFKSAGVTGANNEMFEFSSEQNIPLSPNNPHLNLNELTIASNAVYWFYSNSSSSWSAVTNVASNTDIQTIELYY